MKRTRLRPKGLGTQWKAKLDKLCREVVFARDKETCQWCHSRVKQMHWAHVRSRRYLTSRWDLRNSLVLCAGCHLRWHHQPMLASKWFEQAFPARWQAVMFYDLGAKPGKIDKEIIRLDLEQKLNEYGGC